MTVQVLVIDCKFIKFKSKLDSSLEKAANLNVAEEHQLVGEY